MVWGGGRRVGDGPHPLRRRLDQRGASGAERRTGGREGMGEGAEQMSTPPPS